MKENEINFYKNGFNGTIKVAANQKVIQVHRLNGGITFETNYKAMSDLSTNAYMLYMYMIMLPENKAWALSSKHVMEKTALTKNTYPNAVNELIEKGYLVSGSIDLGGTKWNDNAYHMWEEPQNIPLPENQVS